MCEDCVRGCCAHRNEGSGFTGMSSEGRPGSVERVGDVVLRGWCLCACTQCSCVTVWVGRQVMAAAWELSRLEAGHRESVMQLRLSVDVP